MATLEKNERNKNNCERNVGINDEHGNPYFVRGKGANENLDKPPFYSGMDRAIAEKAPFAKDGTISAQLLRDWLKQRTTDGLVKR